MNFAARSTARPPAFPARTLSGKTATLLFTVACVVLALMATNLAAAQGPIDLGEIALDSDPRGFVMIGEAEDDFAGKNVQLVRDINGDGIPDIVVSATWADTPARDAGRTYVVFGKADGIAVKLEDIAAGNGGFAINGARIDDRSGRQLFDLGDVNGDGLSDLLINSGFNMYVVFGKTDTAPVNLADVESGIGGIFIPPPPDEVVVHGADAGDVNNDGLSDFIIEAVGLRKFYVVFGKSDTDPVDLTTAGTTTPGFVVDSAGNLLTAGPAGDVNGDGLDDLTFRQYNATFVVSGKTDNTTINLADHATDDRILVIIGDRIRSVTRAGDVNGDGFGDLFIYRPGGRLDASDLLVAYGKGDSRTIKVDDLLNGRGGFRLFDHNYRLGELYLPFANAGDVDGDGSDDVIFRMRIEGMITTGASVIFAKNKNAPVTTDNVLNGMGVSFYLGAAEKDLAGNAVAGGWDIDGNGLDDTVIGAQFTDTTTFEDTGAAYVVFSAPVVLDTDLDGLINDDELLAATDPMDSDTDDDGLNDGDELNPHATDPLDEDSDDDGLLDGAEVNDHGTQPLNPDTDGDALSDGDEINVHGTDPLIADTDSDGLTDGDEVNVHGTNPRSRDSDSDGLSDGDEVNTHGTDPLDSDTDDDGLSDGREINVDFTEPTNPDTDGDGITDGDEVTRGTDPLVPESGGGGGCFIATAAYGTPLAQEIDVLRRMRDAHLLDNAAGAAFVDTYYRLSPPIARRVASSPQAKAVVRAVLNPVLAIANNVSLALGLLLGVLATVVAVRPRNARRLTPARGRGTPREGSV